MKKLFGFIIVLGLLVVGLMFTLPRRQTDPKPEAVEQGRSITANAAPPLSGTGASGALTSKVADKHCDSGKLHPPHEWTGKPGEVFYCDGSAL